METGNRLTADRGKGDGVMLERRGRDQSKNMYELPMDMDNGVAIVGVGESDLDGGGQRGKIGMTVIE